jgi:hypothetical protein
LAEEQRHYERRHTRAGDANGDGAVNSTDYDVWRAQFGTIIDVGGGSGAGASQTIVQSTSSPSAGQAPVVDSLNNEVKILTNDIAVSELFMSGVRRSDLRRRIVERWPSTMQTFSADWTELLNQLAGGLAHRAGESNSGSVDRSKSTDAATDAAPHFGCLAAEVLIEI